MLKFLEVKDAEARTLLSKALCIDEEFVPALITLAEVLKLTGKNSKSKIILEKAI